MTNFGDFCFWDQVGETAVVVLSKELGSLDWQEFGELTDEIVGCLREKRAKNIVVDLSNTQIMGSETIGFLIRLRKVAMERGGGVAIANASPIEVETLKAMQLGDEFWHVCSKRCSPSPDLCAECPEFLASCVCEK